jgi:hypothetical protein
MPVIDAPQRKLPILDRDLPVACEVDNDHAAYFHAQSSAELATSLTEWLVADRRNMHLKSA